jgi:hypothetical protein
MHSAGSSPRAHLNPAIAPSATWTPSVISRSPDLFKKTGLHNTLMGSGRTGKNPWCQNLAGWPENNSGLPASQSSQY